MPRELWNGVENRKQINNYIVNKKKKSQSTFTTITTRTHACDLECSLQAEVSQIPTSKAHNFITNAYHDAMRNSNPRPSSRPRNNLRAVTPSEDEAQCAGAEGQESEDRRTRWHCFGKSQSLNNLLDKSKQIPELMVMVEIEDGV